MQHPAGGWRIFKNGIIVLAGFNKLELMQDDRVCENDGVKEAIRLLPKNLYNDRIIHIKRALHLTMRQQILHKEQ